MVKLKFGITKKVVIDDRKEIEVDKGELILIESSRENSNPRLGVLEEIVKGKNQEGVVLKQVYYLYGTEVLGEVTLPIFKPSQYEKEHFFTGRIKEIYVGKEKIAERLRSLEGMGVYADFVERMQKPYIRDE